MARNTQAPVANAPVTFSLDELNKIVGEQVMAALAKQRAAFELALAQRAERKPDSSPDMEKATVAAFKRKGFTDVQPRVNTLTYAKWVEAGRKVKEGEKSVKVKNLRLFHISQTEPIGKAEQAEYLAKRAAKANGKPTSQPEPTAAPEAPASKAPRKNTKVLITEPGSA